MERKGYQTKHCVTITKYIMEHKNEYVTVSDLMNYLREQGYSVGLATLYRRLERLEEEGILRKRRLDGLNGFCYQYCGEEESKAAEHLYMKCEDCGRMVDLDCDHLEELYRHVQSEHHILLKPQKTMFYGVCDSCIDSHLPSGK